MTIRQQDETLQVIAIRHGNREAGKILDERL